MGSRCRLVLQSGRMKVLGGLIICSLLSVGWSTNIESWSIMKAKFDRYNLYSKCYGEKFVYEYNKDISKAYDYCKKNPSEVAKFNKGSPFTDDDWRDLSGLVESPAVARFLPHDRSRRDASDLKEEIEEQKQEIMKKIGMLGCVLTKLHLMKDNQIDISHLTTDVLGEYFSDAPPNTAGTDKDFIQKFVNMIQDCKAISDNWPQAMLNRHPMMAAHGRKKIFFECMFKGEEEICYKWQAYNAMKNFFRIDTGTEDLGAGGDKFEQAKTAWLTNWEHEMDDEKRFVMDFFWSRHRS